MSGNEGNRVIKMLLVYISVRDNLDNSLKRCYARHVEKRMRHKSIVNVICQHGTVSLSSIMN